MQPEQWFSRLIKLILCVGGDQSENKYYLGTCTYTLNLLQFEVNLEINMVYLKEVVI
jgi:hypothetical protein